MIHVSLYLASLYHTWYNCPAKAYHVRNPAPQWKKLSDFSLNKQLIFYM